MINAIKSDGYRLRRNRNATATPFGLSRSPARHTNSPLLANSGMRRLRGQTARRMDGRFGKGLHVTAHQALKGRRSERRNDRE